MMVRHQHVADAPHANRLKLRQHIAIAEANQHRLVAMANHIDVAGVVKTKQIFR